MTCRMQDRIMHGLILAYLQPPKFFYTISSVAGSFSLFAQYLLQQTNSFTDWKINSTAGMRALQLGRCLCKLDFTDTALEHRL